MEAKKSNVAKGVIVLLFANFLCKFLGAFYRIPLSNILGAEGIGIYQLIFPIYSIFLILVSGGISTTLAKIIAKERANGDENKIYCYLKIAFVFTFVFSFIIAAFFLAFASNIAGFQGNLNAKLGYEIISAAVVFSSLITVFRGYFQGYEKMAPTAISQIIEQVFKLVLGLIFAKIFLKWGVGFGVFGALLGVSISEFVSLIYLFLLFNKEVKFKFKKLIKNKVLMQDYKIFFKNLLPIALNSVLIPLITAVDSFLIVNLLMASGNSNVEATKMFGIYSGMINSVINFPTIFALSLSVAILPTLAYDYEKNKDLSKISTSFKTIFFVCAPCFLIFTLFAPNIISLLYSTSLSSSDFVLAKILLILSAGNIIFLSFLQFSTSVLQAINKSYISLVNLLLAAVLKVGLTIYLTSSSLGIFGACIASVLCYLFACFLNLNYLTALCSFKQNKNSYLKILFFSVFAVAMMFGLNAAIAKFMNNNLSFIISGVVSAILYLLLTLKFNVFSNNELEKVYLLKKSSKKVNNV